MCFVVFVFCPVSATEPCSSLALLCSFPDKTNDEKHTLAPCSKAFRSFCAIISQVAVQKIT